MLNGRLDPPKLRVVLESDTVMGTAVRGILPWKWVQLSSNTVVTVNTVQNYRGRGNEKCESYRGNGDTREMNGFIGQRAVH